MRTLAVLLLAVVLPACDRSSPTAPGDTPLFLETIVKSSASGFSTPVRAAARTPGEWSSLWGAIHTGQVPQPALPAVDFDREMVVLAALGPRASGCFAIDVTRATLRRGAAAEFEVVETVPGPGCVCTLALTSPVHAVRVTRVPGAASFVELQTQLRC